MKDLKEKYLAIAIKSLQEDEWIEKYYMDGSYHYFSPTYGKIQFCASFYDNSLDVYINKEWVMKLSSANPFSSFNREVRKMRKRAGERRWNEHNDKYHKALQKGLEDIYLLNL
ncbi:MAG: hypothetical protein WDA59_00035 [Methanofastidiosum sp.]